MGRDVDGARLTSYLNQTIERVHAVPGVQHAAMTSALPLQGWGFGMPFRVEGTAVEPSRPPAVLLQDCDARLFRRARHEASKRPRARRKRCQGRRCRSWSSTRRSPGSSSPDQDPIGQHVLIEQIVTGKRELGAGDPVGSRRRRGRREGLRRSTAPARACTCSYAQSPIVGVSLLAKGVGEPDTSGQVGAAGDLAARTRTRRCPTCARWRQIKSESVGPTRLRTFLLAPVRGAWRWCSRRSASTACCRTSRRSARRSSACARRSARRPGI